MIAILLFSFIAAVLVYLAGRRDAARDPRLSVLLLTLLLVVPCLILWVPKIGVLPAVRDGGQGGISWQSGLMLIWAAGAFLCGVRLMMACHGLRKWRRDSRLIERQGKVEVRILSDISGPVAAGMFRPVIFVPESWLEISGDTRRMILAHELAHHRRRDPMWRLLSEVVCTIYWFQPLVRWMARRFAEQCEYACDAAVLKNGVHPRSYARVLCEFAEKRSLSGPALAMAESSTLESRVRRMMVPHRRGSALMLGLLISGGMTAALALSLLGPREGDRLAVPPAEVHLRLTANPFPGN